MITISDHTLFPHTANWVVRPSWKGHWKTGITTSVSNSEQRIALRALRLHTLSFSLTAPSLAERARLGARVDQAARSGYACVPFFGKGSGLSLNAAAGSNTLTLDDVVNAWSWAVGDYAILLGADDTVFDCWQVTGLVGSVLTLAGNLVNTWPAGVLVRPVLFGKFSGPNSDLITNHHSQVKLTIAQLVAERNAQLGNVVPDAGRGIGHDRIEVNNDIL